MEKLYIVKIGGNIIDDEKKLNSFLKSFAAIKYKKILVHGGGKLATELSSKLGINTQMVNGRRITDAETLKVVTMVYAGLVNKTIVASLQAFHCNAIGLCGADANLIPAKKRSTNEIDYGFAGDINENNIPKFPWQILLDSGNIPVVAPITHDTKGQLLNTNADTIASTLALALSKVYDVSLIFCFEKNGILKNPEDDSSWIKNISLTEYASLKDQGVITKGMIPKLDNAFEAVHKGIKDVYICHADNLENIVEKKEAIATVLHP